MKLSNYLLLSTAQVTGSLSTIQYAQSIEELKQSLVRTFFSFFFLAFLPSESSLDLSLSFSFSSSFFLFLIRLTRLKNPKVSNLKKQRLKMLHTQCIEQGECLLYGYKPVQIGLHRTSVCKQDLSTSFT